jgi:hypothetical protein
MIAAEAAVSIATAVERDAAASETAAMKRRAAAVEATTTAVKTAAAVETTATAMSAANFRFQSVGSGFGDRDHAGTGKRQRFGGLLRCRRQHEYCRGRKAQTTDKSASGICHAHPRTSLQQTTTPCAALRRAVVALICGRSRHDVRDNDVNAP